MSSISCSRRLLSTLFVGLACACSNSLAPGEVAEEYRLVNVANDVLPAALYTTEFGTLRVLSQIIRFGPKGAGSITEATELVPTAVDAPGGGAIQTSFGFHWTQVDGRIEIEFDCPPNANCVAGPHLVARIDGHALRATWGPQIRARSPLRYEEVIGPQ